MLHKKRYHFAAILLIAFVFAAVGFLKLPHRSAEAQASAPSISVTYNESGYAQVSISSGGPFTQDFQIQICVASVNAPYIFCGTTPWASQAGNSTVWSPWVWPGYNNGLHASGAGAISVSVNTRSLPAGAVLSNVVLRFGIAESNGGPGSLGSNIMTASPCDYGSTPQGGGTSRTIYSYSYGSCPPAWPSNPAQGASGLPDVVQIGISASVGGAVFSGTVPSAMNAGQTITNSAVTVTNVGNTVMTPGSWTELANGPGMGTCDTDPDANGIYTAAEGSVDNYGYPITETCTINETLTANGLMLSHTGSFSTPATIPYIIPNVTKVTVSTPGYAQQGFYDEDINGFSNGNCDINLSSGDYPCSYWVPGSFSETYNGSAYNALGIQPNSSVTFPISSLTAPAAAGSYPETWTLFDAAGQVGSYTQTVQIAPSTCTGPFSFTFTDPTITPGVTLVRAVHINELRSDINTLRSDAGLSAYSYADPTLTAGSSLIRAVDLTDLRTALAQVYAACGQSAPTYTDATLTAGSSLIRAVDITQLRSFVSAAH